MTVYERGMESVSVEYARCAPDDSLLMISLLSLNINAIIWELKAFVSQLCWHTVANKQQQQQKSTNFFMH